MVDETSDGPAPDLLPRGRVAFVVTDIDGSTALQRRLGDAFPAALVRHRDLLERACARHVGHAAASRGDTTICVFTDPMAAIAAAIEAQAAIDAERWPGGARLSVRMGVHVGEAEPFKGSYVGRAVHEAMRVAAAGHGGQILLSAALVAATRGRLPGGCTLREVGRFALKDFARPELLHQLCYPGLRSHFPLPRALSVRGHNLPQAPAPFVGRDDERTRLGQLLRERRIVSVVGAPGVGKTRLAFEVAGDLLAFYRDGVWRVDLASAGDVESVARACADVLGVAEERGRALLDSVATFLETRTALLILDACERATPAAARVAATLSGAPEVRVLATSREPLQVTGEQVLRLEPLATRDERRPLPEAAHLLVERIRAHDPHRALDDGAASAIDSICASLDGAPLALELVASRSRVMPLEQIASQLESRFRALLERAGDARARQQMLRETIEWSLELLSPAQRRLFERVSQFSNGFDRAAAAAVCAGEGLAVEEIEAALPALVEAALVQADDEGRFAVSRTLRDVAGEVRRGGDVPQIQQRLLEWALALAEDAASREGDAAALQRLIDEQDNLATALEIGHRLEQVDLTARLTVALTPFWIRRGRLREGRAWAERAERLKGVHRRVRAPLMIGLGRLLRHADPARAERALREGLALALQMDDRILPIEALHQLAVLARDRGDFASAESLLREQIVQLERVDDPHRRFRVETELATLLLQDGRPAQAVASLRERLAEAETHGWRFDRARLSNNLAVGLIELGDHAEALRMATAGAELFRELGSLEGVAHLLSTAGLALMRGGEAVQARRHFVEVGRIALEVGASHLAPEALDRLAALEIDGGRERSGARYLFAADALYASIGYERERAERTLRERLQARLDARIDAATLARIKVDAMMQARAVLTEAIGAAG